MGGKKNKTTNMQNENTTNILGINISTLKKKEVLQKIEQFLTDGKQHQIATPNPEFLLAAREDEEFFYILNEADMALPDGFGLKLAAWLIGRNLDRIAGADLVKDILEISRKENKKVAILNWDKGLSSADDIEKAINKNYPGLKFIAENVAREEKNSVETQDFASLQMFNPDILFCTLGAPWQEKLIFHNLKNWPSVKIAMGVGGSFDYLTGRALRAPLIMRLLGLEWLWRLIRQPERRKRIRQLKRWKRIYNAVIVFLWAFLKWCFILPFFYRSNVACILYKKSGKKSGSTATKAVEPLYEILLVQRGDQPNHWQLPQGGTDGENLARAGEREIKEEAGTDKFRTVACYKNLYKYKFGERLGRYNLIVKNIVGHKGQKQGLCIAEFLGTDDDIKINFWDHKDWKWADAENLIKEVHPVRREAAKIFLEKFKEVIKRT
jgi:N-acetylglucosaminyldiphosphoundecaprenol N-acetyl-beta-D-mannosaminyltransferase